MRRPQRETWLLLAVLPVWGFGLFHTWPERARQIEPHPHYRWFARYAKLAPLLAGEPRAAIVHHPEHHNSGKAKLFKAQYVLAPTIIAWQRKLPRPGQKHLDDLPLIYDFVRPRLLEQVLDETARKAEQKGVTMTVQKVDRALAVVRMRKD